MAPQPSMARASSAALTPAPSSLPPPRPSGVRTPSPSSPPPAPSAALEDAERERERERERRKGSPVSCASASTPPVRPYSACEDAEEERKRQKGSPASCTSSSQPPLRPSMACGDAEPERGLRNGKCDRSLLVGEGVEAEAAITATLGKARVQFIGLDDSDSSAASSFSHVSEFVSCYRSRDAKGAHARRELAKQHLRSFGWTFVKDKRVNKHYVSPNGKQFRSIIRACESLLAQASDGTNEIKSTGMDLVLRDTEASDGLNIKASADWKPVELEAEYSPEIVSLLSKHREARRTFRSIDRTFRTKLKKHLLALGWKIYSKEDKPVKFKYESPDGKTYYSFRKACCLLVVAYARGIDKWRIEDQHDKHSLLAQNKNKIHSAKLMEGATVIEPNSLVVVCARGNDKCRIEDQHDKHSLLDQNENEIHSAKSMEGPTVTDQHDKCGFLAQKEEIHSAKSMDGTTVFEPKPIHRSDAIRAYIEYMEAAMQQKELSQQLRLNAREHLKSAGWKIWLYTRNRKELRYRPPRGRCYNSLLVACKAYSKEVYQQNNDSIEITGNCCSDQSTPSCKSDGKSKKKEALQEDLVSQPQVYQQNNNSIEITGNRCSDQSTPPCKSNGKSKKRKALQDLVSQPRVLRSKAREGHITTSFSSQHRAKTLVSLLMDKNVLLPRGKLSYKSRIDGPRMKEASITREGIKCLCCNEVFTLANFEVHSGSSTRRPSDHIYLKDGRSLSECLIELMGGNKPKGTTQVRLKGGNCDMESDEICSICHDGGELLLCDYCPSAFHHACVGLEVTPEGSWSCPSCRCDVCDLSDYNPDANQFTERTMMYCDQCEREYHVGCVGENKCPQLSCCPEGRWFCSSECSKIFQHLQMLIGKSIPTSVKGLSLTLLRFNGGNAIGLNDYDDETMAEQHGKFCLALDVLHECFVTIIEPRTRSDLTADILFNRESELRRLNFRGFYTILLEKGDELISVGTFRIYGKKIAELPLVGTRVPYRQKGMCRLLMNELEKLLSDLGVERLLLPAVPQLLEIWKRCFGFTEMSSSERLELAEHIILSFQGTTMCQKYMRKACEVPGQPEDLPLALQLTTPPPPPRRKLLWPWTN